MPRLISFVVLAAVVLLVMALFFRVMLEFLVPMFLAAVLVVVFRPVHKWFQLKLIGYPRLAAAATTLSIVLIVLIPFVAIIWNAYLEVSTLARQSLDESSAAGESTEAGRSDPGPTDQNPSKIEDRIEAAIRGVTKPLQDRFKFDPPLNPAKIREEIVKATEDLWGEAGSAAFVGARWLAVNVVRLLIGLVILVISIYYFLADGPVMIDTITQLSPLDDRYEMELFERFNNISRSVVMAVLLSAFVQGVLAGIGYYVVGIPVVFALTGLTMLLAVVPFLGAASVWVPTAAWLYFAEGRTLAAIGLAVYGVCVVSAIDNVIKPVVLHGQSKLHPLLGLLSVLGGVAALGPIGILVGPMAVAFLQALLGMLRREIDELGVDNAGPQAATTPSVPASLPSQNERLDAGDLPRISSESIPTDAKQDAAARKDAALHRTASKTKPSKREARRRRRP